MEKLSINLENCFGIGKFEEEFDFSKSNTILIYAPNGTMKSSFAKTFDCISKNDKKSIVDRAYKKRKTIFEILSDNDEIEIDSILVVNAEDSIDATDKISKFIASKVLKDRYNSIYSELDKSKTEFVKKLKIVSKSSDCENEFNSTFSEDDKDTFYNNLETIIPQIHQDYKKHDFKYNDIFDKKGKVKVFIDKNKSLLKQYFDNYQKLINESKFFNQSETYSFGTIQADSILKSIEDNAFFNAGHKFVLEGNTPINSAESLKNLVESEINDIINNPDLKVSFDSIEKAIGANLELKAFKNTIERNNLLLIELNDYEDFRKKIWMSYISELRVDAKQLNDLFGSKKIELKEIIQEANKELETWKKIVKDFNSRFYVPFTVSIVNHDDVILKEETAKLEFDFFDKENETPISHNKENLLEILSKGEQRAFYILQFLFDIEARKNRTSKTLLIFDDIADSFDYKNKYAIIEYINDLNKSDKFKSIILTHNFDFYRTVTSRLFLSDSVFMTKKDANRVIKLDIGQYRNDIFKHFITKSNEEKKFISLIPFIRNIVEYSDGDDHDDYKKLTYCLHLKDENKVINCNTIFDIFKTRFSKLKNQSITFGTKNIIDLIFEVAEKIIKDKSINEILLENKIVISIAIRLKAEKYLIKALTNFDLKTDTPNQTRILFEAYKLIEDDDEKIRIIDKVNLMTPENIHVNAFMYEPLIDMSIKHLVDLYHSIDKL